MQHGPIVVSYITLMFGKRRRKEVMSHPSIPRAYMGRAVRGIDGDIYISAGCDCNDCNQGADSFPAAGCLII